MVQLADIRILKQAARFYVWVIRGKPLLVQLFAVFWTELINIKEKE